MTTTTIPILDLQPHIQALHTEFLSAIERVLASGEFVMGQEVKEFEREVASFLGVKHAVGVNSGTDALVIALRALGIGEGDEVITTPFSFFATAESIGMCGAKPIFADIDPLTLNISPQAITSRITNRTKAIMPVHLYGRPAAMAQIVRIANEHGLKIVEDCAQSFGARYYGGCVECRSSGGVTCVAETSGNLGIEGAFTGTIGHLGAYSFFPSKNLGAFGDAGLIATNDDALAEAAQMLRTHGSKKKYHNEVLGYNSRLDSIQAAILRVKLPHVEAWNTKRCRVALLYNELLADVQDIQTPTLTGGHVFHQYTVRILNGKRDAVKEYLTAQGISTMLYYPIPQDRLPVYAGQYPANPHSDKAATEVLSLPIWPELTDETIHHIATALRNALQAA